MRCGGKRSPWRARWYYGRLAGQLLSRRRPAAVRGGWVWGGSSARARDWRLSRRCRAGGAGEARVGGEGEAAAAVVAEVCERHEEGGGEQRRRSLGGEQSTPKLTLARSRRKGWRGGARWAGGRACGLRVVPGAAGGGKMSRGRGQGSLRREDGRHSQWAAQACLRSGTSLRCGRD